MDRAKLRGIFTFKGQSEAEARELRSALKREWVEYPVAEDIQKDVELALSGGEISFEEETEAQE